MNYTRASDQISVFRGVDESGVVFLVAWRFMCKSAHRFTNIWWMRPIDCTVVSKIWVFKLYLPDTWILYKLYLFKQNLNSMFLCGIWGIEEIFEVVNKNKTSTDVNFIDFFFCCFEVCIYDWNKWKLNWT